MAKESKGMDFALMYDERKRYIDSLVRDYVAKFTSPSRELVESLNYSVSSGGKRLRAILSLEFYNALSASAISQSQNNSRPKNANDTASLKQAENNERIKVDANVAYDERCKDEGFRIFLAAIELLHLYTLVHDDLPCMDDDDYRRGKKSNHKVFGEGMALLCGDALLNYAFELLFFGASVAKDKDRYIAASLAFSRRTGANGVIGGQALEFERLRVIDIDNVLNIYRHKTCDLIVGGLVFAAILAGADADTIRKVEEFGYHFGIAFQIRDDFLDADKGGHEKNSLLGLIGEQNANIILEQNTSAALSKLDELGITSLFIRQLVGFAAKRIT